MRYLGTSGTGIRDPVKLLERLKTFLCKFRKIESPSGMFFCPQCSTKPVTWAIMSRPAVKLASAFALLCVWHLRKIQSIDGFLIVGVGTFVPIILDFSNKSNHSKNNTMTTSNRITMVGMALLQVILLGAQVDATSIKMD